VLLAHFHDEAADLLVVGVAAEFHSLFWGGTLEGLDSFSLAFEELGAEFSSFLQVRVDVSDLGELIGLPCGHIFFSDAVLLGHFLGEAADLLVVGVAAEFNSLFFGGILEGLESFSLASDVLGAEVLSCLHVLGSKSDGHDASGDEHRCEDSFHRYFFE